MVWGKRISIDGQEIPIRYHLAIDRKPQIGNTYEVFFYTDPDDGIVKAKKPLKFKNYDELKDLEGDVGLYYYAEQENVIYKWDPETHTYIATPHTLTTVKTNDYRTELYMAGVAS